MPRKPSLQSALRKLRSLEPKYILWAIPAGSSDRLDERPMTSFPLTREQADRVQQAASRDGWHSFRLARETGEPPNFSETVQCP